MPPPEKNPADALVCEEIGYVGGYGGLAEIVMFARICLSSESPTMPGDNCVSEGEIMTNKFT